MAPKLITPAAQATQDELFSFLSLAPPHQSLLLSQVARLFARFQSSLWTSSHFCCWLFTFLTRHFAVRRHDDDDDYRAAVTLFCEAAIRSASVHSLLPLTRPSRSRRSNHLLFIVGSLVDLLNSRSTALYAFYCETGPRSTLHHITRTASTESR